MKMTQYDSCPSESSASQSEQNEVIKNIESFMRLTVKGKGMQEKISAVNIAAAAADSINTKQVDIVKCLVSAGDNRKTTDRSDTLSELDFFTRLIAIIINDDDDDDDYDYDDDDNALKDHIKYVSSTPESARLNIALVCAALITIAKNSQSELSNLLKYDICDSLLEILKQLDAQKAINSITQEQLNSLTKKREEIKNIKVDNTSSSNKTALSVSFIAGIFAGVYSQALQIALFGKIFIGNALLFGYAVPTIGLTAGSIIFGITIFSITLAILFLAKMAEEEPLFEEETTALLSFPATKTALWAILAGICILTLNSYAAPIQLMFFGKLLLGGTDIANLGFAVIATLGIGCIATAIAEGKIDPTITAAVLIFCTSIYFANPILQALCGIAITGSPWVIVATSIAVGIITTALALGIKYTSAEAISRNKEYGFNLTIYAVSLLLLSIYATPIQMALLGHTLIFVTPLLSNISFGALTSIITSYIFSTLYRTTEETIAPALINYNETASSICERLTSLKQEAEGFVNDIAERFQRDFPSSHGKQP